MSFDKRNRIVSIRVTQDEYQTLERISRRAGANSVSGFLRQLIMHSETFNSAAKEGSREVTEEIERLKRKVDRLSEILTQRVANEGGRGAIPDDIAPQIGMMLHHKPVTEP
ncbi:MAG: plasmid mobilization protein [Bryobacteraceae bacterium]